MAEIDVIVPARNAAPFIAQTLAAILAQTMQPRRVIVVDDGSNDETAGVVGAVAARNTQIELVRQEPRGLSAASAAAMVAFCDADDVWAPAKLASQHALFESADARGLGVVYCGYDMIDARGDLLSASPDEIVPPRHRGDIREALLAGNIVSGSGSAVLVRRECFAACGWFDTMLAAAEDWDMWLRIAARYRFDFVDAALVHIRRHPQSMQRNLARMVAAEFRVVAKHGRDMIAAPSARAAARVRVAHHLQWYRRHESLAAGLALWAETVPPEIRGGLFADDWDLARAMAGRAQPSGPMSRESLRRLPKVVRMFCRIKLARRRMAAAA